MTAILGITTKTVPFSAFNEGKAGEIFDEVRRSGSCIVMNGDEAECVLVPLNEYKLMTLSDDETRLIAIADERMSHFDMSRLIPAEEVYRKMGITQEELDAMEDVELE